MNYIQKSQLLPKKMWQEKVRVHTQMCLDDAVIAANETLGLGAGRAEKFCGAFSRALTDIAELFCEDGANDRKMEYAKTVLDKRIAEIMGSAYQDWDTRYGGGHGG